MSDIHPSNADAATAWNGPTGDVWTDNADQFDAGVARYMPAFLDATAIEPTAHVLDVGCGNGLTTREAARRAAAVTGVDLSTRMLDLARRRAVAEGLTNVTFAQADVQIADLGEARYDRVISRNGVMFFGDPVAAFGNLARALKPDGRMVLLVWQTMADNPWLPAFRDAVAVGRDLPMPPPDAPGPFALGDPDRVAALLTAAGFAEVDVQAVSTTHRAGSADELWNGLLGGTVRTTAQLRAQSPARRERIRAAFAELVAAEGLEIPVAAVLASGRRA